MSPVELGFKKNMITEIRTLAGALITYITGIDMIIDNDTNCWNQDILITKFLSGGL